MENHTSKAIAKKWLTLSVIAFALSGIISLLLIIGRTIDNADGTVLKDYFQLSIIMHVNFGILMWLLSVTAAYLNLNKSAHSKLPLYIAYAGTALMGLSGLSTGEAYSNNYIPIFDNNIFKLGIGLFLAAIMYESLGALISATNYKSRVVGAILTTSFLAFIASFIGIEDKISTHAFYEYLFWGGGHVLQFAYATMLAIGWLTINPQIKLPQNLSKIIFVFPAIFAAVSTIYIYASYDVDSADYTTSFTHQMIFGSSLVVFPIGIILFVSLVRNIKNFSSPYYLSSFFSLALFALGGILGTKAAHALANGEVTTIIPAHYHGSVIAVTVAMMGLVYHLIPTLTHRHIKAKWISIQLAFYSIGQIMHISGLAILGEHGGARKTAGLETLNLSEETTKLVKFVMHTGGGLMTIGAVMFIVLTLRAFLKKPQHAQ